MEEAPAQWHQFESCVNGFGYTLAERTLMMAPVCRLERQMPVTAKFSEKFYSRFGHDVADELVDWFNKVDATYHTDLRELNELNFARFDAKLEQRTAELRSDLDRLTTELHQEIARLEVRLIRWMFLFWVGTVGTMIALLRFWT